jgi:hypothetical protein
MIVEYVYFLGKLKALVGKPARFIIPIILKSIFFQISKVIIKD